MWWNISTLPEGHRGDREKSRVTLEPDPDQAPVIAEVFHLHADRGLSPKAIADHLNRPGGPPSPRHVDTTRNVRGHSAATTIRAMLRNPVYTGRIVWNRLDFASARQNGGGARLRAQEEWVVSEQAHAPLVSEELFAASQARFEQRPRRQANGRTTRNYLFAGMVHCATGHQPLSMQGKARKGHRYYACSYGATYGDVASTDVHAGQKWIYLREDALLPLVERFFEQRIFGPMRLDKLARQLKAQDRDTRRTQHHTATRLRQRIADAERRIKVQVQALEDGLEPEIVTARITDLREDIAAAQTDLDALSPAELDDESEDLAAALARIPDLTEQLRAAPPATKRQTFEAFNLKITYDKAERRIEVSASITEAIANAFERTKALREEGLRVFGGDLSVTASDIAGAGFEPATFGL